MIQAEKLKQKNEVGGKKWELRAERGLSLCLPERRAAEATAKTERAGTVEVKNGMTAFAPTLSRYLGT